MKSFFSIKRKPWLFSFLIIIFWVILNVLVAIALSLILQLKDYTKVPTPWPTLLANILIIFIVAPFILGFPEKGQSFGDYLTEIRMTRMKPFLILVLLGLSCYLLIALSQAAGVFVFRSTEGLPINGSFIRRAFMFTEKFPSVSGWFSCIPSIFEEIIWRGIVLAAFLRIYSKPKAILFSSIAFGMLHFLDFINGHSMIYVLGAVVWATIIGLFYSYVTVKTNSLLPAIIVHYLGNLFVSLFNSYIQANASTISIVIYGVIFTFGIIPTVLMILWTRFFTKHWLKTQEV
jgi:membrane protease YdiL (CAAX protease family)